MSLTTIAGLALVSLAVQSQAAWTKDSFKHAVYFGDSYSDTGRMMGKSACWAEPEAGGFFVKNWPLEVSAISGVKRHNYAQSGSSCSKAIAGNGIMPGVKENQIPAFQADLKCKNKDGSVFLNPSANGTVYTTWIGTNDLGAQGLLPKADASTKVPAYVECVFGAFDSMYAAGGRKFVLMNVIPLNLLPLYTVQKGNGADGLYPNKPATAEGLKEANKKLEGLVLKANTGFVDEAKAAMTAAKQRYPEAEMALFDVHKMISDIYQDPKSCLTAAGANNQKWGMADANMWGDPLHPSPALGKCIAKEFVNVVSGSSEYATYLPSR